MGYYADLIKEKRNAKYSYNLVKKGEDKWVIQTKYGGKTVDEQEFYGTEEGAKRKGENNVRYFESRNEKENASVQDRFRHKGCMITILKKGENQYTFTVEQDGREEGTKAIYPTQDKAESEAKKEVEANWNEKEEGYYAKLSEEKSAKKNSSSSLNRAINLILSYLQDGWTEDKIKRELKSQHNVTDEDIRDGLIAAKRLNKHI